MSGPAPDFIADLPKTELLRLIVALAAEVHMLADRQRALETILRDHGIATAALDAPTDPAAFDPQRKAARDGFVERVFGALTRLEARQG